MARDSSCLVCAFPVEDIHHVLRSCSVALAVGRSCIRSDRFEEFLQMEVKNWLLINLGNGGGFVLDITNWNMLFGSILWNIWLRMGLKTAVKAGLSHIMVESDNLNLINRIVSKAADWVAKNFRSSACPRDWPTNVPPGLKNML
ncbi:hypothetical protein GQ457_04G005650 [Hibiscus cannabinus]